MAKKAMLLAILGVVALAGAGLLLMKKSRAPGERGGPGDSLFGRVEKKDSARTGTSEGGKPAGGDSGGVEEAEGGRAGGGSSSSSTGGGSDPAGKSSEDTAYLQAPPLSEKEVESVKTMLAGFANEERGRTALNRFVKTLNDAGLGADIAKNENPYTGRMLVVRTQEALEGTRYLHAQYFEDEDANKEPFLQHLSFEIRPSPDCMQRAKALLEELLGKRLPKPEKEPTDSWVEWKVDGYSYWIHRLGREDIPNHPFNARVMADIGSCQVAKEQIPDEDHSQHH